MAALYRFAAFAAIAASAILVVEYQNLGDPAFCGPESDCLAVARFAFTKLRVAGTTLPMPQIGLIGFAVLLALDLLASPSPKATDEEKLRAEKMATFRLYGSIVAGIAGLALFLVQATLIKDPDGKAQFCKFCVVVDVSAMIVAATAVARHLRSPLSTEDSPAIAWGGAAVLGVALPMLWGAYPVQPALHPDLQAMCVNGQVNILQFTDFECPFCRALHPEIDELRKRGNVHVRRIMVPLQSHRGAEPAARLYVCTPDEKKDEIATRLYETSEHLLTRDGMFGIAEALLPGVDVRACFDAKATTDAIEADQSLFEKAGGGGLPHTYIGRRVVSGARVAADGKKLVLQDDRFRRAFEAELSGSTMMLNPLLLYALLAAAGLGAAAVTAFGLQPLGRPEPAPSPPAPPVPAEEPRARRKKKRAS